MGRRLGAKYSCVPTLRRREDAGWVHHNEATYGGFFRYVGTFTTWQKSSSSCGSKTEGGFVTDIPWSSRTIPWTLTSAISYSEIIPFCRMIVTQKWSFTNPHLKHSNAWKTWDICFFITTYHQIPNDRSAFSPCNRLDCRPCPFINSLTE